MFDTIKTIFSIKGNNIVRAGEERVELIDFLRGGAMILVLLHHSGFPLGKWILAFHMPFFFMLSGYTVAIKSNRSQQQFGKFVIKKAKR